MIQQHDKLKRWKALPRDHSIVVPVSILGDGYTSYLSSNSSSVSRLFSLSRLP